jgi:hypothetical protein
MIDYSEERDWKSIGNHGRGDKTAEENGETGDRQK